jgi:hypothetical protein
MARVYGFATSDVFVIDIESNHNSFAGLVKTGCSPKSGAKGKGR